MPHCLLQMFHGNPIFNAIKLGKSFRGTHAVIHVESPPGWESFATRVQLMDPCKGCMDPDELQRGDLLRVTLLVDGEQRFLTLPIFTSHLCDPSVVATSWLLDEDEEENEAKQKQDSMFDEEGTNTGFLLWDSAVHMSEYLVQHRGFIQGKNVLELGCGLGLPGFVCALLGASKVGLTDRPLVAKLCAKGISLNGLSRDRVFAEALEWRDGDVKELKQRQFHNQLDVIIACDCVFAPLFGDSFLLLNMLEALTADSPPSPTLVLLGIERRLNDGVDDFFVAARKSFDVTVRWAHTGDPRRVAIYELTRRPQKKS